MDFWKVLKDKKVSILVDNALPYDEHRKESYVGKVMGVDDGFLLLYTDDNNSRIQMLIVKLEMILSVWVYKGEIDAKRENAQQKD